MSKQNAIDFLREVRTSEELLSKMDGTSSVGDIATIAGESGYEFSAEEFYAAQVELSAEDGGELSEEELSDVAGGLADSNCGSSCGQNHHCHNTCADSPAPSDPIEPAPGFG